VSVGSFGSPVRHWLFIPAYVWHVNMYTRRWILNIQTHCPKQQWKPDAFETSKEFAYLFRWHVLYIHKAS